MGNFKERTLVNAIRKFLDVVQKDHPEISKYEDYFIPQVRELAKLINYWG